jgi:hypothetical protein
MAAEGGACAILLGGDVLCMEESNLLGAVLTMGEGDRKLGVAACNRTKCPGTGR